MKLKIELTDDEGKKWYGEFDLNEKVINKVNVRTEGSSSNKPTIKARILGLKRENYFAEPKIVTEIKEELKLRGFHYNIDPIRVCLLRLVREKTLRRVTGKSDKKTVYKYVNP